MATLGPAATVEQPRLVPPTTGLIVSANIIDEPDNRWQNGFTYLPEGCGEAEVVDLCSSSKNVTATSPPVTGQPYGLVAQYTCSTFAYQTADYVARATRKLMAMESWLLERELWEDTLGLNPHLADAGNANLVNAGAVNLLTALAIIEQAAIDVMPARRLMIHMRPVVLELILAASGSSTLIRFDGARYYTPLNNIIVPGLGYTGTAPNGSAPNAVTETIYATTVVDVRRGPIEVIPAEMKQATNRAENQVTYFAERAGHASFDYECSVVYATVTKTLTVS